MSVYAPLYVPPGKSAEGFVDVRVPSVPTVTLYALPEAIVPPNLKPPSWLSDVGEISGFEKAIVEDSVQFVHVSVVVETVYFKLFIICWQDLSECYKT
ncbi:MAG TPA: hypothetical protein DIC64_05610 [Alphaproteobacteria bacterium]|nr:hypothetical protein [Alphaproteobacteria bacterium]